MTIFPKLTFMKDTIVLRSSHAADSSTFITIVGFLKGVYLCQMLPSSYSKI